MSSAGPEKYDQAPPTNAEKMRFLHANNCDCCNKTKKEYVEEIDILWRQIWGGPDPKYVNNVLRSWETRMTPRQAENLKEPAIMAICRYFTIKRTTWDSPQFYKRATEEMRAAGKLANDPPIYLPKTMLGSRDIWELAAEGREVELTLQKDATEMFGLLNGGPIIPTFVENELAKLGVSLDFDAKLLLIHMTTSQEREGKKHHLVVPSVFMRDGYLPAGKSVLPTEAPAGHPLAFAMHHPIGVHYLLAVAVSRDADITLPTPAPDMKPRDLTSKEMDALETGLSKLTRDLYGIGVACYQVAN